MGSPLLLPIPNFYWGQFSGGKFWCQSCGSQNWPRDGFPDLLHLNLSLLPGRQVGLGKLSNEIEFWKCNSKPRAFGKGKPKWSFSECFCQNNSWILLLLESCNICKISSWIVLVEAYFLFRHLWLEALNNFAWLLVLIGFLIWPFPVLPRIRLPAGGGLLEKQPRFQRKLGFIGELRGKLAN